MSTQVIGGSMEGGIELKIKAHWLTMILRYCLIQSLLWKHMAVSSRWKSGECSKCKYLVFLNVLLKLSGQIWHF